MYIYIYMVYIIHTFLVVLPIPRVSLPSVATFQPFAAHGLRHGHDLGGLCGTNGPSDQVHHALLGLSNFSESLFLWLPSFCFRISESRGFCGFPFLWFNVGVTWGFVVSFVLFLSWNPCWRWFKRESNGGAKPFWGAVLTPVHSA